MLIIFWLVYFVISEIILHIESSESIETAHDIKSQISESSSSSNSDKDGEERNEIDSSESVFFTSPDGVKVWTPASEISAKNPNINRNGDYGSRIKYSREISMEN